jgi:phage shock protein E
MKGKNFLRYLRNASLQASVMGVACMVSLAACTGTGGQKVHSDYNVGQAREAIEKATVMLLDVRTPEEFANGHISGAVNIDWYDPAFSAKAGLIDKNTPLLVYCAVGGRSAEAQEALKQMGFKNIHNLTGGFDAWRRAGLAVELP